MDDFSTSRVPSAAETSRDYDISPFRPVPGLERRPTAGVEALKGEAEGDAENRRRARAEAAAEAAEAEEEGETAESDEEPPHQLDTSA